MKKDRDSDEKYIERGAHLQREAAEPRAKDVGEADVLGMLQDVERRGCSMSYGYEL